MRNHARCGIRPTELALGGTGAVLKGAIRSTLLTNTMATFEFRGLKSTRRVEDRDLNSAAQAGGVSLATKRIQYILGFYLGVSCDGISNLLLESPVIAK